MAKFIIRTINSVLHAEGATEQPRAEEAMMVGVKGAASIALEEVTKGGNAAAVEVSIENEAGELLLRSAVSVAVAPLTTNPGEPTMTLVNGSVH